MIIISFLRNQTICVPVTLLTISFDVLRDSKDNIQNHVIIIIMEKFFIYQCKLNNKEPTLKVFIVKVKLMYDIKRQKATKQNVMIKTL